MRSSRHPINEQIWQRQSRYHRWLTVALLAVLASFVASTGWLLTGDWLIWLAVTLLVVWLRNLQHIDMERLIRYQGGAKIPYQQGHALYYQVEQLAQRAGLLAVPDLYYVPAPQINAFAAGTAERPIIAISAGALRYLNWHELTGVLAHEMSHIRNHDLLWMQVASTFTLLTRWLCLAGQLLLIINLPLLLLGQVTMNLWGILALIVAPVVCALVQLMLSRTREYDADLNAVRLTGDPDGLAHALLKIEQQQRRSWLGWLWPWRAPAPHRSDWLSTHPLTEQRIARLMALKPQSANALYFPDRSQLPEQWLAEFHHL